MYAKLIELVLPKFTLIDNSMQSPKALAIVASISSIPILVPVIVNFYDVLNLLVVFFIADFLTGMIGSFFEWKKKEVKKDKWFFGRGEGFSSEKFKKMFVKALVYISLPFVFMRFQEVFHIKRVKYEVLSTAELDLSTCLLLLFILNEGFSIFHENLPKCGINIWKSIKQAIGFYKEIKKDINE
jgi:phage-related holin